MPQTEGGQKKKKKWLTSSRSRLDQTSKRVSRREDLVVNDVLAESRIRIAPVGSEFFSWRWHETNRSGPRRCACVCVWIQKGKRGEKRRRRRRNIVKCHPTRMHTESETYGKFPSFPRFFPFQVFFFSDDPGPEEEAEKYRRYNNTGPYLCVSG